jgi:hypothetical protein
MKESRATAADTMLLSARLQTKRRVGDVHHALAAIHFEIERFTKTAKPALEAVLQPYVKRHIPLNIAHGLVSSSLPSPPRGYERKILGLRSIRSRAGGHARHRTI